MIETARELIARLSAFPEDTLVVAEWEGTLNTVGDLDVVKINERNVLLLRVDGMGLSGNSTRLFDDEDIK